MGFPQNQPGACVHTFGRRCIIDWFLRGHNNCPLCRAELFRFSLRDLARQRLEEDLGFDSESDLEEEVVWGAGPDVGISQLHSGDEIDSDNGSYAYSEEDPGGDDADEEEGATGEGNPRENDSGPGNPHEGSNEGGDGGGSSIYDFTEEGDLDFFETEGNGE